VAEGMIALEHAAKRYRPDRGASFGTFAATAINNVSFSPQWLAHGSALLLVCAVV
jgi:hypothetical protein